DGVRQLRYSPLVLLIAVTVHKHDRGRAVALAVCRFEIAPGPIGLERNQHLASSADALLHLDDFRIKELGENDVPVEDARPVLVGYAQGVAKAARDEEHGALALALQERVGRDGRAHLHDLDAFSGDGCPGGDCEQLAYSGDRGIAVAAGILGEQLVGEDAPVRAKGDDIGESAAAVDPELPFFHAEHGVAHRRCAKLTVATDPKQVPGLERFHAQAKANGVADLRVLSAREARALEPQLACVAALESPSTGIVDSHAFMLGLRGDAEAHGAAIAFRSPLLVGHIENGAIELEVGGRERLRLLARAVVNSAGLFAQDVARSIEGFPAERIPPAHYCK